MTEPVPTPDPTSPRPAQLEPHEQLFRRMVEAGPVGIAAGNLSGRLILVNDAYLSMFGFSRAEFEAGLIDWTKLTPPEYLPADGAAFARAFKAGSSGRYDKEMLTRDGVRFPVSVTLMRYDASDSLDVVGYVQDLRPFRVAEEALRTYSVTLERQVTERTELLARQNAELEARTRALEGFAELSRDLALETNEYALIHRAQHLAQSLLPAGFAVYYEPEGGLWRLRSQVGDLGNDALQAALDAGLPFESTRNLLIPWRTRQPFYQDAYDMNLDGQSSELVGQLQSTATIPVQVGKQMRGIFAFGLNVASHWRRADKAVLESIALSLGNAIERVQKNRSLDAERAALEAFAQFTEQVAHETDVRVLARQAVNILTTTLGPMSVAYYELEDGHWKVRAQSQNMPEQLLRTQEHGLPQDTPLFTLAFESPHPHFLTDVGTAQDHPDSALFGAAALYPYLLRGRPHGLLAVGTLQPRDWTDGERGIIRAVGRSLGLALERTEAARHLREQNAELEARTRALEGFAELNRDINFQSDPYALIGRAQQLILSLIPPGYAEYYEVVGGLWVSRVRTGERRNPALQATVDRGMPYEQIHTLRLPYEQQRPYYQDTYQDLDHLDELGKQIGGTATVPVIVNGEVRGIMAIGLFTAYRWDKAERAVLETIIRSLALALEGAQSAQALRERTLELERSNRELEQFAYVASHDLQEPLRTVTSFSQLLLRRLDTEDPKALRYGQFITDGTERMGKLIQDLLAFSRITTQGREFQRVDTQELLGQVVHDLGATIRQRGASVEWNSLPPVQADATQVRQLFQNLIGNALKFTVPERPPVIRISAVPEGAMVKFTVQDNGIGIAKAHFERIFTIFQRLHSRETYEGTGIGLALVRRIVEHHGGQISLESTPGEGTAFFFTLPTAR